MSPPRRAVVGVMLLVVVACGEGSPAAAPSTSTPGPTSPTPAPTANAAQEYRTAATVLEGPGHGPQLCHAVAESYPPQCVGPDIVGWDWDAVDGEQSASGVTWVDAVLTGTWDGERFTPTRPVEPASAWSEPPTDPATFAPGCDDPDVVDPSHGRDEVQAVFAPLEAAGVSSIRVSDPAGPWDGPFVLTVLVPPGRGDDVTALIRRSYEGALCVVERDLPTMDELAALHDEVLTALTADGGSQSTDTALGPVLGSATEPERGVVVVQVFVADEDARAWVRQRWGDRVELEGVLRPVD